MGLDSFWTHPEMTDRTTQMEAEGKSRAEIVEYRESFRPKIEPPLNLCGGLFSGNGNGSFRGKVYDDFIEGVTGVSLYQEEIDNPTVKKMADSLEAHTITDEDIVELGGDNPRQQFDDLKRMFRAYADAGFSLCGWW